MTEIHTPTAPPRTPAPVAAGTRPDPLPPLAGRLTCLTLITVTVSLVQRENITLPVGVLGVIALLVVAAVLPRLHRSPWAEARWRPWAGYGAVALLVAAGWIWPVDSPDITFADGRLPDAVPLGLVAAFAVGVLVSLAVESGERIGLYSAVTASVVVTVLDAMTDYGPHTTVAVIIGWPSAVAALALAVLTRRAPEPAAGRIPLPRGQVRRPRRDPVRLLATAWVVLTAGAMVAANHLSPAAQDDAGPLGVGSARSLAATAAPDRSLSAYLDGQLNLRARGPLADTPFAAVPADSPRLWRAGFLNEYNSVSGHGWTTTNRTSAGTSFLASDIAGIQIVPPYADVDRIDYEIERNERVTLLTDGPSTVLAPGEVLSIDSPDVDSGLAFLTTSPGGRLVLKGDLKAGTYYRVGSQEMDDSDDGDDAARLKGIPVVDPSQSATFKELYLQVPISLPTRVIELGRTLVRSAPDRISAIKAVEAETRRRIWLTDDAPVTPTFDDVVDDALFVTHQGYSDQFASAEAMLLRAGGIPARIAYGFNGGERTGRTRVLRERDLAIWVEAWVPGSGWVKSDPAPQPVTMTRAQRLSDLGSDLTDILVEQTVGRPVRLAFDVFIVAVAVLFVVRVRRRPAAISSC